MQNCSSNATYRILMLPLPCNYTDLSSASMNWLKAENALNICLGYRVFPRVGN